MRGTSIGKQYILRKHSAESQALSEWKATALQPPELEFAIMSNPKIRLLDGINESRHIVLIAPVILGIWRKGRVRWPQTPRGTDNTVVSFIGGSVLQYGCLKVTDNVIVR